MTPHSNNADIIINPIIYFVISYHIVDINSLQEKATALICITYSAGFQDHFCFIIKLNTLCLSIICLGVADLTDKPVR